MFFELIELRNRYTMTMTTVMTTLTVRIDQTFLQGQGHETFLYYNVAMGSGKWLLSADWAWFFKQEQNI